MLEEDHEHEEPRRVPRELRLELRGLHEELREAHDNGGLELAEDGVRCREVGVADLERRELAQLCGELRALLGEEVLWLRVRELAGEASEEETGALRARGRWGRRLMGCQLGRGSVRGDRGSILMRPGNT